MTPAEIFERMGRHCEKYTGRPWDGTNGHIIDANARQAEVIEILESHAAWMQAARARVERSGDHWNTTSCRRQSRLDGDLTAPPEWIGELSERLTPEWGVNR